MKRRSYSLAKLVLILFFFSLVVLPAEASEKKPALLNKVWGCSEYNRELKYSLQRFGLEPGVSKSSGPQGKVRIVINLDQRTLTVYADGKPYKKFPVAIGKSETPSPIGEWRIIHKATGWGTGFGTRWLGLNVPWGIYGIHGTNKPWSIGSAASHGCFRMHNKHVEEIFAWVKVGTPITVEGNIQITHPRLLEKGHSGQDVVLIQQKLRAEKFLWTPADGRFGPATERALILYQLLSGLPATGQIDKVLWQKMLIP